MYTLSVLVALWILATLWLKAPIVVTVPRFWYSGITIGWLVIIRRENYSEQLVAHEFIHFKQQRETLIIPGYILYFLEFICKSIYYKSIRRGYSEISFEREAHLFCGAKDYVFIRKPFVFRHFIFMKGILTINKNTTEEEMAEVYALPRGQVFKYDTGDYFTVYKMIEKWKPADKRFRVQVVQAGTSLFAVYGLNTMIVIENTDIP